MSHVHGNLVYVWRVAVNKLEGPRLLQKGRFVGLCRVLATETRVGENGNLQAGSVICDLVVATNPPLPKGDATSSCCLGGRGPRLWGGRLKDSWVVTWRE